MLASAADAKKLLANIVKDMLGSQEYKALKNREYYSKIDFLFPRKLQVTPTPLSRILFVGSCVTTDLTNRLGQLMPGVEHDFILFNNAADLPASPPSPVNEYAIQVLQIPLRTLLTDQVIRFHEVKGDLQDGVFERAITLLDMMLDVGLRYNREHNTLVAVTNFIVPQTAIASSLKERDTPSDIAYIIRRLNDHIAERVAKGNNVFLLDVDAISGSLGKDGIVDDWFHIFSHNTTFFPDWIETPAPPFYISLDRLSVNNFRPSLMIEFFRAVCRQIEVIVRVTRQIDQVKLVVFDLDNTLWRGQIAEHYRDGAEWPYPHGWPEGLPEMIHHLRARGILVAICSKNDEEVVRSLWERASPYNWLTLDDLVIRKINWQPKAINIAEIMQETSLTAKSVVFVDDNPVEREAVKTAFPEIRVIGDNPFMTRSILLRASETQVAFLSQESSRRETMIRKQIDREKERVGLSREDFLMGLNCKVRLTDVNGDEGPNFRRAFELLNRTNQFNTTGRRWTNSDVRAFFGQGGRMFAFNVVDKFTDYGLVGVIMILDSKIEQFVMSCRILGLEIEKAVLSVVIGMHRDSKVHPLIAKACSTKDNMVCRDLYPSCGFVLHQREDDIIEYVYDQDSPRIPNHIELICEWDGANSVALAGVSPA